MHRANTDSFVTPSGLSTHRACNRGAIILAAAVLVASLPVIAQAGGELQQKLAALKQSTAENQQKLHKYEWTETTQLTLKGDAKPPSLSMCQYGPDGKVQKTPMSAPPPPPSGGRFKQKIVAKKTAAKKPAEHPLSNWTM